MMVQLLLFLVAAAAIFAGGFFYLHYTRDSKTQATHNGMSIRTTVSTSSSFPTTSQVSSVVKLQKAQDCGTVQNATASDAAQQEKNAVAYSCMSKALTTCSPATLTVPLPSGIGSKTFDILSINDNACQVSKSSDPFAPRMTCNLPLAFISAMAQFLQARNQSAMLAYSISLFFQPPSAPNASRPIIKNPLTGQIINIQCHT